MDFYEIVDEIPESKGFTINPFASKKEGEWHEGGISIDFLNKHFANYETAKEMKNATNSEGLKKYFEWLKEKGILN